MAKRTVLLNFRLTPEQKAQLDRMAAERNITTSALVRERVLGNSFVGSRAAAAKDFAALAEREGERAERSLARSSKAEHPPVKRTVEGSTPSAPVRGGVAGSTGGSEPPSAGSTPAPGFTQRVAQLHRYMSKANAERVARTELGLD